MTSDAADDLFGRLAPEVLSFQTPHFALEDDLRHLDRVQRVQAPEAMVLYGARILEALAAEALQCVGLAPGNNVFDNLDTLEQFNLVPTATRYWAHALRRTGNWVRHVRRRVRLEEADLAVLFLERWLDWYFCRFRHGRRLPSLTRDGGPLDPGRARGLRALLEAVDACNADPKSPLPFREVEQGHPEFFRTPVLPALLGEMLLDRKEHAAAFSVLAAAQQRFADDARLGQLLGLYWKRTGQLDEALRWMEPLYDPDDSDGETAGILAGICKALWLRERGQTDWLKKSHQAYRHAWERSGRANPYLGVNSATTLLWRGRPAEARRIAEGVRRLLLDRAARLAGHAAGAELAFNYWDQVNLAEAEMLLGNWPAARQAYRDAQERHPEQRGNIEVSCRQLTEILGALGRPDTADEFLRLPTPPVDWPALVVGVTGHRSLPADEELRRRVAEALDNVRRTAAPAGLARLVLLSPLAEGADRLLAELVLAAGGALHILLPLELADYEADFSSPESLDEFRRLFQRADAVLYLAPEARGKKERRVEPDPGDERAAAYEKGGRQVVDRCTVLVALWDGEPSRGRGGTAEVVAYARAAGKPLAWVCTTPPYPVAYERLEDLSRN